MKTPLEKPLLTRKEIANLLGTWARTVQRNEKRWGLDRAKVTLGRRVRYRRKQALQVLLKRGLIDGGTSKAINRGLTTISRQEIATLLVTGVRTVRRNEKEWGLDRVKMPLGYRTVRYRRLATLEMLLERGWIDRSTLQTVMKNSIRTR